jgi:hypothetical protein
MGHTAPIEIRTLGERRIVTFPVLPDTLKDEIMKDSAKSCTRHSHGCAALGGVISFFISVRSPASSSQLKSGCFTIPIDIAERADASQFPSLEASMLTHFENRQ